MSPRLMGGASLKLASRQESFQDSRVGVLTSYRRVGAKGCRFRRGWMLHMAFSYKAKYCVQQHAFLYPHKEESTIHRRLAQTGLSILLKSKISSFYGLTANDDKTLSSFPLSLQNGKRAVCFPFTSFRILVFYNETFHLPPRNLRIEDFADPSRRLADLWSPEGIHTVPNPVEICRQQTKFAAFRSTFSFKKEAAYRIPVFL